MTKYFGTPFANTGDRDVIPDSTQPDGSVSYAAGFGFDYERDLNSTPPDPDAKAVPRAGTNGILYDITDALRALQRFGAPEYFPAAAPYAINSMVRHSNVVWRSLIDNNNSVPGSDGNWTAISSVPIASEMTAGIIEIATAAGTATGADGTRAVTPAGLKPLLDAKAPIASPGLTGNPTAPTQNDSDSSTRLANTQWVRIRIANALAGYQAALGFVPVQQGGGIGQANNKLYIGWDGGGLRLQVDGSPQGQFLTDVNGDAKVSGYGYIKSSAVSGLVMPAVAAAGHTAIGTFGFFSRVSGATSAPGDIVSGADLRWTNGDGRRDGGNPPGVWRCHGSSDGSTEGQSTLWQRVS
ncbi:hypothetical protein [Azorhizophilus paspali]|uniref:Uncharacterized protein n=1 Tax=Azorhizophilus paspali TaxID=69963 RepID=A0ABV6SHJ4_AZOPA